MDPGAPTSLQQTLVLWETTRQPMLVQVLDVLQAEQRVEVPNFRQREALHRYFLTTAVDGGPEHTPWLGANLLHWLPGKDQQERADHLLQRLRALRGRTDPRLARALVEHARLGTGEVAQERVQEAVMTHLARHLDVELVERMVAMAARRGDAALRGLRRWLAERTVPPPTLDEAVCARWIAGHRGTTPDRSALLAAVARDPDDDEPRAVLADLAIEQGEPWGTFAQLQLREATAGLTPAERQQVDALLRAHGRTWLGPLGDGVRTAWFRRGFLDALRLEGPRQLTPMRWRELARSPVLATVRALDALGRGTQMAPFVPFLPNLQRIRVDADEVVQALLATPPRDLQQVRWTRAGCNLEACQALGVREVHLPVTDLDRLGWRPEVLVVHEGGQAHRVLADGTWVPHPTSDEPASSGRLAGLRR